MKEEAYGWLFINKTPLLYNKKNVDRQKKVEKWLNLYQITRALKIDKNKLIRKKKLNSEYVI